MLKPSGAHRTATAATNGVEGLALVFASLDIARQGISNQIDPVAISSLTFAWVSLLALLAEEQTVSNHISKGRYKARLNVGT